MSSKKSVSGSTLHAQRHLFFRFCATISLCFIIIVVAIGLVLVHQLDHEQKKLLNSIAAEYQRILTVHDDQKLRDIAVANPQQLIEHQISLLSINPDSSSEYISGSPFKANSLTLTDHQWNEHQWYQSLAKPGYLTLLLQGKEQRFWLVLSLRTQLNLLYQQWLWIATALALLCVVISIIVFRLIRSTLSPLHQLASVIDQTSDWSIDSRILLKHAQVSQPAAGLDVLHQSTNLIIGRLLKTIHSLENTVDAIAHDLRTPLARVILAAESALSSTSQGQVYQQQLQHSLSDCAESAQQANHMLVTLMSIHDEVIGKHALKTEQFELGTFIEKICSWYQELAEESDIEISSTQSAPLVLVSDQSRLTQVIVNLIDNAFKYSNRGGKITLLCEKEDADQVAIYVTDAGVGIAKEHHQLIFRRLYRVDSSRSTLGYGLGLAHVKVMLSTLGGNIELDSALGKGSSFKITLPIQYQS